MLDEATTLEPVDNALAARVATGAPATGAYHCSGCGYGVSVQATLPRCPMCGGTTWEPAAPSTYIPLHR